MNTTLFLPHRHMRDALHRLRVGLMILFLASPAVAISQSTYYVALNGSDSYPGTLSQPFRTIAKGVSVLGPGKTLYIRAGTYAEDLSEKIPGGTSWSAPVVVSAYPGESVTLQPSSGVRVLGVTGYTGFIIVQGLTLDGAGVSYEAVKFQASGDGTSRSQCAHDIRMISCEVKNSKLAGIQTGDMVDRIGIYKCNVHNNGQTDLDHGIYLKGGHCVVDSSIVHDNTGWGIHFYSGIDANNIDSDTARNNLSYNNATLGQRGAGIGIYGPNNVVFNNVLWGNAKGMEITYGANYCQIYNNTIVSNRGNGIDIAFDGGPANYCTVENNIIYGNGGTPVTNSSTGSTLTNNLTTDPSFVNAGAHDYHLVAGSTAAIDRGVVLSGVPRDRDGVARPQGSGWDIGAYEFASAATVLAAPAPVTPTTGSTGVPTTVTLSWSASSGATSYRLQVSTRSDFASTSYDQSGLTTTSQQVSSLLDSTRYYWRVSAGDADAASAWSTVWNFTTAGATTSTGSTTPPHGKHNGRWSRTSSDIPVSYGLAQNYPNPFNPSTTIEFALPEASPVSLAVYDILGAKVRTLVDNEFMGADVHSVVWNGTNDTGGSVSSGLYICIMKAGSFVASQKMYLVR